MRSNQNPKLTISRLEGYLSNVLKGASLEAWTNNKISELLRITGQSGPPLILELSSGLLKASRIKDIRYRYGLPEWGRLVIENDGFIVELSPTRKYPSPWFRLTLAHEVAHTLLYDTEKWPPRSLVYLEPGHRDLEWLCWYLASRLLIPTGWLSDQIERFPIMSSENFSLKELYQLEKIFSVPWRIVANRLVEDLGLWNCIMLQFVLSREVGESPDKENVIWRLKWHTIPPEGCEALFIPVGRRTDGIIKFPKAKGRLVQFITDCFNRGQTQPFFCRYVNIDFLKSSTTGNLDKFLHRRFADHKVKFYCTVKVSSDYRLFEMERSCFILMCFPLEPNRNPGAT